MPATLVAPLVSGRSKHKETWCSLVFRVFRVFHVFHVFHVFPSSEPPKTIKRSTAVYSVQPTTAIGVLYNYNMTRKDGQKQAQELLCCGGTPTMLRNEWRCGGARGDVDTVTGIRAGKVPMISVS